MCDLVVLFSFSSRRVASFVCPPPGGSTCSARCAGPDSRHAPQLTAQPLCRTHNKLHIIIRLANMHGLVGRSLIGREERRASIIISSSPKQFGVRMVSLRHLGPLPIRSGRIIEAQGEKRTLKSTHTVTPRSRKGDH